MTSKEIATARMVENFTAIEEGSEHNSPGLLHEGLGDGLSSAIIADIQEDLLSHGVDRAELDGALRMNLDHALAVFARDNPDLATQFMDTAIAGNTRTVPKEAATEMADKIMDAYYSAEMVQEVLRG